MTYGTRLCIGQKGVLRRRTILAAGLSMITLRVRADDEDVMRAIEEDFGDVGLQPGKIEIAMPEFSDSGSSVPMDIFVPCDMTEKDYPREVRVYAPRNPRPRVIALYFTPACGEARMSTRVRLDSFQDVVAIAEMSDGQVFEAIRNVNVTYGACEAAVANDQFPPGWAPSMRVAVPQSVAAGEIFTVRTIINHPMETGLRRDNSGLPVPIRIAERFTCRVKGTVVFRAELKPAISANPYISFSLQLTETAQLDFEWIDTTGAVYSTSNMVSVSDV